MLPNHLSFIYIYNISRFGMHRSQFNDRQYKLSCHSPSKESSLSWFTVFTSSIRLLAEGRWAMVVSSMADHFHCLRSECCWGKPVGLETHGQRRPSPTRSRGGLGKVQRCSVQKWKQTVDNREQTERSQHDRTHIKDNLIQSHWFAIDRSLLVSKASLQNSVLQLRAEANLQIPCAWT